MGPILVAHDVEKSFTRWGWLGRRRLPVLTGADLTLLRGEALGLVGENGSGRTTLMRILVGDLTADAGTVELSGTMGYCPQQPVVYPRHTCDAHFELFAGAYRMTTSAERRARRALYEELGFERFASTRAGQLSGGTLAKLNLGLALLPDPDVLLLDEPYAGFDWDTYQKFWGAGGGAAQPWPQPADHQPLQHNHDRIVAGNPDGLRGPRVRTWPSSS